MVKACFPDHEEHPEDFIGHLRWSAQIHSSAGDAQIELQPWGVYSRYTETNSCQNKKQTDVLGHVLKQNLKVVLKQSFQKLEEQIRKMYCMPKFGDGQSHCGMTM